jgi:membrane-associated protein
MNFEAAHLGQWINSIADHSLLFGSFVGAMLGDRVRWATGNRFGRPLFKREDSWLFHKKYLVSAQGFSKKHGKKAIVMARFVSIVRTFTPIASRGWAIL